MLEAGRTIRGEPVAIIEPVALDARGVLRHLRRGWATVLLGGLLSAAGVLGALRLVPSYYTASVEILIDPAGLNVVGNDIVDRRPQNDSGLSLVESQVRILRSDGVLARVVRKLDLGDDPEFAGPGWADRLVAWLGEPSGAETDGAPAEAALDALRRAVAVSRPERTLIAAVYVETLDADKSARIANAVAEAFFEAEAANRAGTARRLSGSLDEGLEGLRAAVAEAEARILRHRRDNGLFAADGTPLGDQQLGDLNQQLVAAEIRTAEARARLDQGRRARPEETGAALPEMLQSRELRALRQRYAALSGGMAELSARLGGRHPALSEQAAQERDLRRQIQAEKERIVEGLRADHDRAAASEAAVRGNREAAKSEVRDNAQAEVGLRELERELKARRAVYEATLRRIGEIGAQERIDTARIRVISPAAPAPIPTWPAAGRPVLLQALALGLVVGATLALVFGVGRDRRLSAVRVRPAPPGGPAPDAIPDPAPHGLRT